jgi:hypothetical protein
MSLPSGFSDPKIEVAYGGVFSEDDELQFGRMSMPPMRNRVTKNYEQGPISKQESMPPIRAGSQNQTLSPVSKNSHDRYVLFR